MPTPGFDELKRQAEALLYSARARWEADFKETILDLMEKAGLSGNRFSSSLTFQVQKAAIHHVQAAREAILRDWRSVLSGIKTDATISIAVREHASLYLADSAERLKAQVNASRLPPVPRTVQVWIEEINRQQRRLQAELEISARDETDARAIVEPEIVELHPNLFGFGLDLRALW